jgi:acyl carrier protein
MKDALDELVRQIVARHLGRIAIDIELTQHVERDLGMDPLDLVLIGLRLEDVASAAFPFERLEGVETVGDLIEVARGIRDGEPILPHVSRRSAPRVLRRTA